MNGSTGGASGSGSSATAPASRPISWSGWRRRRRPPAPTADYFLNIALAYGGRNEIVHAARSILREVREGAITPEKIDPALVEHHLYDGKYLPPVDLIIRTGNERRTSNFLPWLANGKESAVYFCAPNWPDFRKIDLLRALRLYDQRMRGKGMPANG